MIRVLRPNRQRAQNAITLIWIILGLEIVAFISSYFQYDLLNTILNGGEISMEEADANDTREQIIAIIHLIAHIVSGVVFIKWFRRAYYNLHQVVKYLSYSEESAASAWFMPIIGLYRPYQIMKELYSETKKLLTQHKLDKFARGLSSSLLGLWWTLWIISAILGQVVFRYTVSAEVVDEMITATTMSMVSNIIGIPLAIIAVKVIQSYSSIEPLLNEIVLEEDETTTNNF